MSRCRAPIQSYRSTIAFGYDYGWVACRARRSGVVWLVLGNLVILAELMPQFETTRRVRHKPADMFNLVADVERYPEFVPMCDSLRIKRREKDGNCDVIVALMTVSYKLFRESFTSRVTLDREAMQIRVNYLDGPFKHLENRWFFRDGNSSGCEVVFKIAYEFRSPMLAMLMGAVFERAFRKFAAAFEERADKLYGTGSSIGNCMAPADALKDPPPA